jgi:hypothetical protein
MSATGPQPPTQDPLPYPSGAVRRPERRPLKVFAFDPMLGRAQGNRMTLSVPNERVLPGPTGAQVEVIDYDGSTRRYYEPVDLDDPHVLMQGGLDPTESDPRFHQQMVYAVAAKVIENFERGLGRRFRFHKDRPLRLFPHAFRGANAFYDPAARAILFGYFTADEGNPGLNLPGQDVFTCLSHDVIAHEMTHAIVHRLRRRFLEPSNRDVLAFHEGFSDIVAIFQHFSFPDVLPGAIQETRSNLRNPNSLIRLAQQFGYATGGGEALRSAVDKDPGARLYETILEPHERGSILVAAVFDAFFIAYQERIKDLVRIATGGTGHLPEGDLHPDLVNRMAREAARTAQHVLNMCIRAFDYLPPVDVNYGDFLRALVTADYEFVAAEDYQQRAAAIEAFRRRGIYPEGVVSLAEESLLWQDCRSDGVALPVNPMKEELLVTAQAFDRAHRGRLPAQKRLGEWAQALTEHAKKPRFASLLELDPTRPVHLDGLHSAFRVQPDGQLKIELVAQFTQRMDPPAHHDYGGIPVRGGATVVATVEAPEATIVKYVVAKPLPGPHLSKERNEVAEERLADQRRFVEESDREDAFLAWSNAKWRKRRMRARADFRELHGGIQRKRG